MTSGWFGDKQWGWTWSYIKNSFIANNFAWTESISQAMPITANQVTAFFRDIDQIGLSARMSIHLQSEGILIPDDLIDFTRKDYWDQINGVPQERRRTVNPLRGKTEFLANETVKVNPNGGKQGGIPKKESPGIANKKSNPNGRQKELVPRRPRGNSNKNPRRSNSAVRAEAKGNTRREILFEFYA